MHYILILQKNITDEEGSVLTKVKTKERGSKREQKKYMFEMEKSKHRILN